MNQEIIPDRNLPVYLQRYNVDILDVKKESVGRVLYTTVGALPSNREEKRVWSLNLTGYLKPNVDKYTIVYDFSKVNYMYKEDITFENIISGTFILCGRVLDASKMIGFAYKYNDNESTLTIELDTSKWDFRLKKEVLFSYQLNVDDDADDDADSLIVANTTYKIYYNGSTLQIKDGSSYYSSFTLPNIGNTGGSTTYSLTCSGPETVNLEYSSTGTKLSSGKMTAVNSYNVLYSQSRQIESPCDVTSTSTEIGNINFLPNDLMNPFLNATGQATEEAIINALISAETMTGINNNTVYKLPHDRLKDILKKYNRLNE